MSQKSCTWSHVFKIYGTIWACGYNGYGQLGNGNTTNQTSLQ